MTFTRRTPPRCLRPQHPRCTNAPPGLPRLAQGALLRKSSCSHALRCPSQLTRPQGRTFSVLADSTDPLNDVGLPFVEKPVYFSGETPLSVAVSVAEGGA